MTDYRDFEIKQIQEFIKPIYQNVLGYVKFVSQSGEVNQMVRAEDLQDEEKLKEVLHKAGKENAFISLATYRSPKKGATKSNLMAVTALALDIDYSLAYGQGEIPLEEAIKDFQLAVLDGFPEPTYLEYSRNFRAVYVLKNPYVIKKGKSNSCQVFLERITKCLADELNNHNSRIFFNVTPHKLTSFLRLPGSLNVRNFSGRCEDPETGTYYYKTVHTDKYCVDMTEYTGMVWDIDKLAETVLPPLFEGYEEWKKKKAKESKEEKKEKALGGSVAERRLRELEELQRRGYDVGYREKMCYFYWVSLMQFGYDECQAYLLVQKFNEGFRVPLDGRSLRSNCLPRDFHDSKTGATLKGWQRRFRDKTIREQLGLMDIEPDLFQGLGMSGKERKRKYDAKKRAEKIALGQTKKDDIKRKTKIVVEEREKGTQWKEIAKLLGVAVTTAIRYLNNYKKEKEEEAKKLEAATETSEAASEKEEKKTEEISEEEIVEKLKNTGKKISKKAKFYQDRFNETIEMFLTRAGVNVSFYNPKEMYREVRFRRKKPKKKET